jgi:hypothetical protein
MTSSVATSQRNFPLAFGVFLLLVFSALFCLYMAGPPFPVPATAPATEFSAERALELDRHIASAPHPAGSPANEKVRDYMIETLRSMGIAAEVYAGAYVDGHSAGEITNVLARIPGTANTRAVALEAHYDSVPYGPGAADDGAGVSALLETARALRAGPPLMNDVLFVFTDAEEGGLRGAKVFGRSPRVKDVGVLLNFETRGVSGASLMFETSDQNGWLIEQMVKSGVPVRANSLMYDVYKRMPFSSDLAALKPLGIKGLNFAFIDDFSQYHTMDDSPGNLSLASLQHHGEYALGLARQFGNLPLEKVTAPDIVYFNALGSYMVTYSFETSRWLVILTAAAFVATLALGFLRKHLSVLGIFGGILAFPITALCAALVTAILLGITCGPEDLYRLYRYRLGNTADFPILYRSDEYGWAFFLVTVAVMTLLYSGWRRFIRTQNLAAGSLVWWFATMIGAQRFLPGAAYLFNWPLLLTSIGLAILFLSRETGTLPAGRLAFVTVLALPGLILWLPTYQGFMLALTVFMSPPLMVVACLLLSLLIPQLDLLARPSKSWLPSAFGAAGMLLWLGGMLTNTVSPLRPNLDSLSYGLDLDAGKAYWLSADQTTDEWTSRFFPPGTPRAEVAEFKPGERALCLKAPAPVAPLAGPSITVLNDTVRDNVREITLRVTCPDKPSLLRLGVSGSKVLSAAVFGQQVHGGGEHWGMRFNLMPRQGVELALRMEPSGSIKINTVEEIPLFPESLGIPPRPNYIIPVPNTVQRHDPLEGERTFVKRSFEFPAPELQAKSSFDRSVEQQTK